MASNSPRRVNVLFVWLGNICRSPMAEGVFRNVASSHPLIDEINSASTSRYHVMEPPDPPTMIPSQGLSNYNHLARKATRRLPDFDYLLAMKNHNLRDLLEERASVLASMGKRLFGDFRPGGVVDERVGGGGVVQDPYYGGVSGFEEVYEQVAWFSKGFLEHVEKKNADAE